MAFRRWLLLSAILGITAPAHAAAVAVVVRSGFTGPHGARVYYEASGTGAPVVFLSGGNWMDFREFDGQFLPISEAYTSIRYDARGSGQSDPLTADGSAVGDLTALLDAHKIRAAHLVSLSRSTGTALDFALAHPERVLSLTLMSPIVSEADVSAKYRKREAGLLNILKKQGSEWFSAAVLDDDYFVPSGGRKKAKRLLEANSAKLLAAMKVQTGTAQAPPERKLADVKVPTLVLVGDSDDPELLPKMNALAAAIPGSKKFVLEGSGHTPNLENGRKVAKILRSFLDGDPLD